MKRAHAVTITAFAKPEEDKESLKEQLIGLIPFDLGQEKLQVKETAASGFNDRKIVILEARLEKERHTNSFLDALKESLSGAQKQQLLEQRNRLDNNCDFFLRFQKQQLPRLVFTDGGDCVHVKISIAAFPKKQEEAWRVIEEIFK